MEDDNIIYVFRKGVGWCTQMTHRLSPCWCCGSDSIYCCEEGSPFYDTLDYWVAQARHRLATVEVHDVVVI